MVEQRRANHGGISARHKRREMADDIRMPEEVNDLFLSWADELDLPFSTQVAILLGYIQDHEPEGLEDFLKILEAEMLAKEPAKPVEPVKQAEMTAFFDRDLARASLKRLAPVESDGQFDRAGYKTARLLIPVDEFVAVRDILSAGQQLKPYGEGEIVCGWYYIFDDGATVAIALTNASERGPFLDPFLIHQNEKDKDTPNVSLKACRALDKTFAFEVQGGPSYAVQLVPTAG
jgi:hypothetical protein